ncbi:MAG: hypothetical protein WC273_11015 [Dehalococcoidia bacterium]
MPGSAHRPTYEEWEATRAIAAEAFERQPGEMPFLPPSPRPPRGRAFFREWFIAGWLISTYGEVEPPQPPTRAH